MANLSAKQLLEKVLEAIQLSGWKAIVVEDSKPFRLRLFREEDDRGFTIRVYIWNCTHGGGLARPQNEYRVQLTTVVPSTVFGETTLILGWHDGYEVFVSFDIKKHEGQDSSSPSIQIKEEILQSAYSRAFSIYRRQNGEMAVSFKPEFFVEYALNSASLHATGEATVDFSLLNHLNTLTAQEIVEIQNNERQTVVSQIVRKFRATDFRRRVLGAYGHRCSFCGLQLDLIDAAHIIPVASNSSTDETRNGIALCKLHHAAYDKNLLSFDEFFRILFNQEKFSDLLSRNLIGGMSNFRMNLRPALILPNDQRDRPPPEYIRESKRVRGW